MSNTKVDSLKKENVNGRCWLEMDPKDKRPPIRQVSSSQNNRGEDTCRIEFGGLTLKEFNAFEQWGLGQFYLLVIDGRLHAYSVHEELPTAEEDPLLAPHWPQPDGEPKEFGGVPPGEGWHTPSIIITGVGVGARWPEQREQSKRTLEACGFDCLRSRRGDGGRHWEQWVLHGIWSAKGPLKVHMDEYRKTYKEDWHKDVEVAARFIAVDLDVKFGSLDITIQRWALSCGD